MKPKGGYFYIMSNKFRTVLYSGVTSHLQSRVYDHKNGEGSKFTSKYLCYDLVYFEFHETIEAAIEREKQVKKWNRAWKEDLIKKFNPRLVDLRDRIEGV